MQASNHSFTTIDVNGGHQAVSSLTDNLVSDDSNIPYALDIRQEDNISIQMLQLYQKLLPSKESHDKRVQFVNSMERLLNTEWPNHNIKANVFGSSVNDLGTSSSDVDLCLTTTWNGLRNVKILAKLFRKCGMQHIVCVPRAKVPIVRLFDPELQLSCDINVNNTLALLNTKMIKTYVNMDPRVRPFIMIIKHWTKERLLNDAANGGTLSSYTWTCMVINFLQQREPPILPVLHQMNNQGKEDDYFFENIDQLKGFSSKNYESLGGLLYAFFRRFAIEFNYNDQVISVRQGRYLTKVEKGWDTGRNKISLCVEEPCNPSRNLGNSADVGSVRGLRIEFHRFLDLLLAGESLDRICTPYKPVLFTTEIPSFAQNPSLSLTLPSRVSANDTSHPFDRRKSMVDGIYLYKNHHQTPYTSHLSNPYPQFSSPQVLDSVLNIRKSRHGSHPLPPVPSRLLSMLNISANHGTDLSVDKLFGRYNHRKEQNPIKKKPVRRRSSGIEWPSITNHTGPTTESHRSRRWSIVKKHQPAVEKKPTLAEIVKVHIPSTSKPPSKLSSKPPSNKSTPTSTNRKQKTKPSSPQNKQRKKHTKPRA